MYSIILILDFLFYLHFIIIYCLNKFYCALENKMQDKKPTKCLTKSKELTGREIIQDFVMMLPGSMDKYHQLCSILNTFHLWSEESRISFLGQFFDSYDILDVNCSELVFKLCKIRWHTVPSQIRSDYANFLCALAINHVHHIKLVFNSLVGNFLPIDPPISEALPSPAEVDDQLQESLYALTHLCIQNIVSCNPVSVPLLLKCFAKKFPHIKQPTPKLLAFMQNVLHFADWIQDEETIAEVWSLIIEKLLHIDALCFGHQNEEQRSILYSIPPKCLKMQLNKETADGEANPMKEKLNLMVEFVLNYLGDGDTSKVTLIRDDDRASFLQIMRRFSPNNLESTPANKEKTEKEDGESITMEEGYEEELMAM